MFEDLIQTIRSRVPSVESVVDVVIKNQLVARLLQGYGNLATESQQKVKLLVGLGIILVFLLVIINGVSKVLNTREAVKDYENRIAMLMEFEQKFNENQRKLKNVSFVDIAEQYGSARAFLNKIISEKVNPSEKDFLIDVEPGKRKKDYREVKTKIIVKKVAYRQLLDLLDEVEKYKSSVSVNSLSVRIPAEGKDELMLEMTVTSMKKL